MCVLLQRWSMTGSLRLLDEIRSATGKADTDGLPDSIISKFLETDPSLSRAIEEASMNFQSLVNEMGEKLLSMKESELSSLLQADYVNFYSAATVNPYVAIAARGPWIVTSVSYTHLTLPTIE